MTVTGYLLYRSRRSPDNAFALYIANGYNYCLSVNGSATTETYSSMYETASTSDGDGGESDRTSSNRRRRFNGDAITNARLSSPDSRPRRLPKSDDTAHNSACQCRHACPANASSTAYAQTSHS